MKLTNRNISNLNISTRLLAQEAIKKGYELEFFASSPSTQSGIVRGVKNGRELFFKSTCTLHSPSLGVFAADNKVLSYSLLVDSAVNTPALICVQDYNDPSITQALKRFKKVVVKPVAMNHGDGVTMNIATISALKSAIQLAQRVSGVSDVIIQKQISGKEYRFLVVDKKVIAVAHRRPPSVVGDGKSTILQLIELTNSSKLRGDGHKSPLTKIDYSLVSAEHGEAVLSKVLPRGERFDLLYTSNLSKGGESVNVTNIASKALKKMAVKAAAATFLGVAGVDIITDDITSENSDKSYVIEVNTTPGIRMHQFPSDGEPINVARKIFSYIEKSSHPIKKPLVHVGKAEVISFPDNGILNVPVRIDTGATTSSLWASEIHETRNGLSFVLFAKGHSLYTGRKIRVQQYSKRAVATSTGHMEVRYLVKLRTAMKGRRIIASFTLSDRSKQVYPILIGRNILKNKFVVDVSSGKILQEQEKLKRAELKLFAQKGGK
jgi:D-alanine-D-alanine ligase-like ATP-grasp enzyme